VSKQKYFFYKTTGVSLKYGLHTLIDAKKQSISFDEDFENIF
jgi:hypothetical protein